ncbi:DUF5977 domain-containing protein [Chryseobacterium sp. RRHN12]|uniref:DUF5977 domain-containing protein n=1 Tax=Chryseobacterium sp. RRHN12 TaxID=3437884 RepID=UPI003D9B6F6E
MKNYIYILLLFINTLLYSQDKSISSYALIKGVETSNKLYSGLVNVSVPLYQISLGNELTLASNLTYESNGFRPHIEPDIVGLNWNVNLFGKITRETRRPLTRKYSLFYNKVSGNEQDCFKPASSNFTKKVLLENPISTSNEYFTWMTDKYYFDFFGYKGYFVIDHNGKTIVFCENANLTVDINNLNCQPLFGEITFSEITLKDDKGNIFIFGGSSNELEINYHQLNVDYSEYATPGVYNTSAKRNIRTNYIVGWNLKKIILYNGRIINATYKNSNKSILNNFINEGKNVTTNFTISFPDKQTLKSNNLFIGRQENSAITTSSRSVYDGTIGEIVSGEKNTETIYSKQCILETINISDFGKLNFEYDETTNPLELTKVYLKKITVFDTNNLLVNNISLSYDNLGGTYKRTFLKKVSNEKDEEYSFDYYKTNVFPQYNAGNKNTMGFWNGKITYTDPENPDKEIFKAGLLKRILLPTRGYKEFFYESHKYSMIYKEENVVENVTENKYYGARLYKEVNNDGIHSYTKNYKYVDNSNKSTGILDQGVYYKPTPVVFMNPNGLITYTAAMTSSTENLSPNMYSSDLIHYTEVQEIDEKGVVKYFFTNRKTNPDEAKSLYFKNPNFNGITNLGEPKLLSKENERGKLTKVELIDVNGILKSSTEYTYKNFLNNTQPINEPTSNCSSCKITDNNYYVFTEGLPSSDGRRMYIPVLPYLPENITTTEYFGNKSITTNFKKTYNDKYLYWHPFPIETKEILTDGSEITKNIYYPGDALRLNDACLIGNCNDLDYAGGKYATYKNLLNDNFIEPVITIEKNAAGKNQLSENIYTKDANTSNVWKVTTIRNSLLNADFSSLSNVKTEDQMYYQLYDDKGNLLQNKTKQEIPTTTIWGYNQTLPLAQIQGITYVELMQIFGLSTTPTAYLNLDIVKKSNVDKDANSEQLLISSLETFRKNPALQNYSITTYTYNPLVGITSKTSPNGIRENYIYDTKNRLGKITNISGETIKDFNYNYASPYTYPTIFYNSEQTKTFTRRNCGAGFVGGTYTYTVPAETYSSTSKGDAEQQALYDLEANGQLLANTNAVCIPSECPFTPTGGLSLTTPSVIYNDGNVVKFSAYISTNNLDPNFFYTNRTLGLISGNCKRTLTAIVFTFNEPPGGMFGDTPANRTWEIRVDIGGNVSAKLISGTIVPGRYNYLNFTFQFDKN